jgi:hypothetical protein
MPTQKFSIALTGSKQLALRWKGNRQRPTEVEVLFDGQTIGSIFTYQELQMGRKFSLPDGSTIFVQAGVKDILVFRNGACLNDLFDRHQPIRKIVLNLYMFLGLNLFLGLTFWFGWDSMNRDSKTALLFFGFGFLYLVLTLWARQRISVLFAIVYLIVASANMVWIFFVSDFGFAWLVELLGIINTVVSVIILIVPNMKREEKKQVRAS